MRIISGKYRGRKLASFQAGHLRPTTDRVKESIFNKLTGEVANAQVLDLFAGTGNLGIEALSRDAESVVFVEMSAKSLAILKKNLELLKIDQEARVIRDDVFKFIKKSKGRSFHLIFVDPPFTEKIAHPVMEALSQSTLLYPGGILVIESGQHERIDEAYPPFNLLDRRSFGDKTVSFFTLPEVE